MAQNTKNGALFSFDGLRHPVSFSGCGEMVGILKNVLRDWPFGEIPDGKGLEPSISVRMDKKGFHRESKWLKKTSTFHDPVNAACDFIVDLVNAYVADNPGTLCLHCAAVEFSKGLVIFPSTYKVGKSALSGALAQAGGRVFSDDVLPLTDNGNKGMALGILPRLRLPLPRNLSQSYVDFIRQRGGERSRRFLYIHLNEAELAPYAETAPVAGVVILKRREGAAPKLSPVKEPKLSPVKESEAVKAVVHRNFAREVPALDILERLQTVVRGAESYKLQYDTVEQAVTVLADTFGIGKRS